MAVEEFTHEKVHRNKAHPLNMARAVMFPRGIREDLGSVYALLVSQSSKPAEVTLHVRGAATAEDFSATKDIAVATAKVAAGRVTWVKFPVKCHIKQPFVWFWIGRTPDVSWCLMRNAPWESCRAYGNPQHWSVQTGQYYACYTDPPTMMPCNYRPQNITNGVGRIVERTPNMWASDPKQPLPQWIELTFPQPVQLTTVCLTFDTDMNGNEHDQAMVTQCVKNYRLEGYSEGAWHELAAASDNFQRHRTHHFAPSTMEKLRLVVTATGGDHSARVFGIRAYDEPPTP